MAATPSWITLNLGHALCAWTRDRRALHDYLAGTRVEHVDPADTAMPMWGWVVIGLNAMVFVALVFTVAVAFAMVLLRSGVLG